MHDLEQKLRKEIAIQNVVSTADLKQSVELISFNKYTHLSSNLELYKCGYVKDDKMIGRVSVFASGKMISVGTKSPNQSKKELRKTVKILEKYGLIKTCRITVKVQNIVGKFDLKKKLNIESLARTIPKSMYEPEQFPLQILLPPYLGFLLDFLVIKGISN